MRLLKLAVPVLVLALSATTLLTFAQSDSDVVASFKKYVSDYMASYKTDNREQVVPLVGGKWRKQIYEPGEYSLDVRRTDSLISPYLGLLDFAMTKRFTADHDTKEEAEKDNTFRNSGVWKHKHTYAYQDGEWIPKSRQNTFLNSVITLAWDDCVRSSGCFWDREARK